MLVSSRLILLRSTLRISISSLENVTLTESPSKKIISPSANKALWGF